MNQIAVSLLGWCNFLRSLTPYTPGVVDDEFPHNSPHARLDPIFDFVRVSFDDTANPLRSRGAVGPPLARAVLLLASCVVLAPLFYILCNVVPPLAYLRAVLFLASCVVLFPLLYIFWTVHVSYASWNSVV